MKKKLLAALVLSSLLLTLSAYAEDNAQPAEPATQPAPVAEAAAEKPIRSRPFRRTAGLSTSTATCAMCA